QVDHINNFHTRTLTGLAWSAFYIKRKSSRLVTVDFGFAKLNKHGTYISINNGIRRRVVPWRPSYRTLVDFDDLVNVFQSFNAAISHGRSFGAKEMPVEYRV